MSSLKYQLYPLIFVIAAALPAWPQLQPTDANVVQSPDHSRIAFDSWRDGDGEIYAARADGSAPQRLTHQAGYDWAPVWSPDGGRIAFVSQRDGNDEIYIMQADGSNPIRLTHRPGRDWQPTWSPDGRHLAFMGQDAAGNWDIYTVASDGSSTTAVRLTDHADQDGLPVWSPDGRRIAFVSQRDGDFEIYTMQADGTRPTRLTYRPGIDAYPAWSADSTEIIFTALDGERAERLAVQVEALLKAGLDNARHYAGMSPRR